MEAIAKDICRVRKSVCPRSSYSSGGSGATKLLIFEADSSPEFQSSTWGEILKFVVQLREFDESQAFSTVEDLVRFGLVGHVIFVVGTVEKSTLCELLALVDGKRSSLMFQIKPVREGLSSEDSSDDEENSDTEGTNQKKIPSKIAKEKKIFTKEEVSLMSWRVRTQRMTMSSAGSASSTMTSSALTTAFNGQPGVWTKQQFRYLWGMLDGFKPNTEVEINELDEGRLRTLQRLSTKSILGGKKLSMDQWDELIRKALLEQNCNDLGIYNLIREKTLGKTIADSLRSANAQSASSSSGMGGTEEAEDGRADHLVDATFECIPASIRDQPQRYIKSLLDYGCAEGSITATLGQRLKLPPEQIFGADVRAITSRAFNYVQLPAEDPANAPTTTGTILPTIADKSISIINCAMVFHHVLHTTAIMKELRRVIDTPNGLLVIREHDCRNAPTAAFLDILHGLFSLGWKDPIEWPNFISEYKAYYRSREEWSSLLQQCGFKLHVALPSSYSAAESSIFRNGRCPNVTRAYYAVYVPDWSFEKRVGAPMTSEAIAASRLQQTQQYATPLSSASTLSSSFSGKKRLASESIDAEINQYVDDNRKSFIAPNGVVNSRQVFNPKVSTPAQIIVHAAKASQKEYQIYESTTQPGRFFKFYPANERKEWIHFL